MIYIIFQIQKCILFISYYFFLVFRPLIKTRYSWVVGVTEVASNLFHISKCLDNSCSICLNGIKYYNYKYDYNFHIYDNFLIQIFLTYIISPALLGYLCHLSDKFMYTWSDGFLISKVDGRFYEFSFLYRKGKVISCFYSGNDIRSLKLERELGVRLDLNVAADYYQFCHPEMMTEKYDKFKYLLAISTNKYAKFVFNADADQSSYLNSPSLPYIYFFPDQQFSANRQKFSDHRLKIIHAPTSPIVKGTQIVRSAIKKLSSEGFDFEYIELQNVSNEYVLNVLRHSHIVLNEFFMFSPGLFGIEAMANFCVLMTSADENIERSLPRGSNDAWVVTRYFEVEHKLRWLLLNRDLHECIAESGYNWALQNASISASRLKLNEYLKI